MELDRDIVRMEKELAGLYQQRWSLLEREMQSAKARVESLLGTSSAASAGRGAASSGAAYPVVAKTEKKSKRAAKSRVKAKAGKKRTRMSTSEVERRLIDTVRNAGSSGISLIGISEAAGLNYQTAAKKLKEMSNTFVKKGELKEARYFLKA